MPEQNILNKCDLETLKHIREVQRLLGIAIYRIVARQHTHDESKLHDPERSIFAEALPRLAGSTYGTPEYREMLDSIKPALEHHYEENEHHPEHYPNGIFDMDLIDVIEMFCDWCAAVKRHDDGDVRKSIEANQKRFGYSDDLKAILRNTAGTFGEAWPDSAERADYELWKKGCSNA